MSGEWSFTNAAGVELRIMRLPDRQNLYLILTDDDGMRCVARTLGDREATALVAFLDSVAANGLESASERLSTTELGRMGLLGASGAQRRSEGSE